MYTDPYHDYPTDLLYSLARKENHFKLALIAREQSLTYYSFEFFVNISITTSSSYAKG